MSPRGRGAPSPEDAFGQVLRELRRAQGLSQEALAFACQRHPTHVSQLERGKYLPTVRTLFLMAEPLAAKPSEVLRRVEALLEH